MDGLLAIALLAVVSAIVGVSVFARLHTARRGDDVLDEASLDAANALQSRTLRELDDDAELEPLCARAHALYASGDPTAALAFLDQQIQPPLRWTDDAVNSKVCVLTALGRYREAVDFAVGWQSDVLAPSPDATPWLLHVNVTEALYCLGDFESARVLLQGILEAEGVDPLARFGALVQLAWLEGLQGEGRKTALLLESEVGGTMDVIPPEYQAETHFTLAQAALVRGHVERARAELDLAERVLARSSSARNLLVLRARVLEAEGKLVAAQRELERAVEHPYKHQSGEAWFRLGELRERMGDLDGARQTWANAVEVDPQSHFAQQACERLGA